MRWSLAVVLAVVTVAGSLVLDGCQSCTGFANSFANDSQGEPTPRAAIDLWLATAEPGYDTNPDHWHASTGDPLVFHADSSKLTVVAFQPPGAGYLVGDGSSC